MILIDNRNVLRIKDRDLLNQLSVLDNREPTGNVIVEQAKTGVPTIKISLDGRIQYLQSKYDPQREAERFAGKYDHKSINQVLFVGVGLGYHIQKFMETHPDTKFSIYEPNEEVFHAYLSNFQLDHLPIRNLVKFIVGKDQEKVEKEVQKLLTASNYDLKIITLPVYEGIYGARIGSILEKALGTLKEKHSSLATNVTFQKRWTINSIKNFPTVLKTANILHDIDRSTFEGKPAIIVAAGPSLNEEFENLRHIKENGLAYIFSVGSAINALIEQKIYPDAACTYDPKETNQEVFEKLKSKRIDNIPLIFGSSVGYETIENYPGKMLHMITNQDTIAPNYLNQSEDIAVVMDAPSIAVVTYQLLSNLGCSPIILVGQNLAYRNNRLYAAGIEYDALKNELSDEDYDNSITVKDVYGNLVQTNDSFNRMRQELEKYIKISPNIEVFNATKGGAHIEGTHFVQLEQLLPNLPASIVKEHWYARKNSYSLTYNKQQVVKMMDAERVLINEVQQALDIIGEIDMAVKFNQSKDMEKKFNRLDDVIAKISQNHYQKTFIRPMLRVHHERLNEKTQSIRFEKNPLAKGGKVVQLYGKYIMDCQFHLRVISPYVEQMHEEIISLAEK